MALIVMKFGGTSVANADKIRTAASRAVETRARGDQVVMVVSARGKKTDELITLAAELTDDPGSAENAREMDALLATGEQESASLTAMAIRAMGVPAVSLTGGQIGIDTDAAHSRARISAIATERMRRHLDAGEIVVACGFQGTGPTGDITTLGRGGSDTTATALAAALGADECEINTDVPGVFTTDPRKVPDARKVDRISYDEMLELASLGAGVMHGRSIEFAKKFGVPLRVRLAGGDGDGTLIGAACDASRPVVGLALVADEARVSLDDIPDQPGAMSQVFDAMAARKIPIDMVVQNVGTDGLARVSFTVPESDLAETLHAADAAVKALGTGRIGHGTHVAKLSAVGRGMANRPGVAAKMFRAVADAGINISMVTTSEIKISTLIDREHAADALRAVHAAFELHEAPPAPVIEERPESETRPLENVVAGLAGMEDIVVSEVALDATQARVTLANVPDVPGASASVLELIAEADIPVDMIVQNSGVDGRANLSITVPRGDENAAIEALGSLLETWQTTTTSYDPEIATLGVSGVGLRSHTGVGRELFKALADADVNVRMVATSEVRTGVVVADEDGRKAERAALAAFELD